MDTYKIIRFHEHGSSEVVLTGLTLDAAQAHCRLPSTRGEDEQGRWFDGYAEEG